MKLRMLLCLFLLCVIPLRTWSDDAPAREPAAVMSHEGAPWLERPGREEEDRPDLVLEAMALTNGDVVADIGCGSGFFTRRLAEAVGPEGRVYGVDIQPEMLELLRDSCKANSIENVVAVLGEEDDPNLPAGEMDWILLVDTYHEFQDPQTMLRRMRESLAPDGKIALVEFRLEGDSAKHIKLDHRMSPKQVLAEWNPAGFQLIDIIESLPTQHLFIFAKDEDCVEPVTARSADQ